MPVITNKKAGSTLTKSTGSDATTRKPASDPPAEDLQTALRNMGMLGAQKPAESQTQPEDGVDRGVGGPLGRALGGNVNLGGPIGGLLGQQPPAGEGGDTPTLGGPLRAGLIGLTGGGLLGQALPEKKPDPTTPEGWAKKSLSDVAPPPADNPHMQHAAHVRSELGARGLPTNAEGVRVFVSDVDPTHGGAVTRSVAGPTGLAQGADARLQFRGVTADALKDVQMDDATRARMAQNDADRPKVDNGELTMAEMADRGVVGLETAVHQKRAELGRVRAQLPDPPDGKTSVLNMSWGTNIYGQANNLAFATVGAPKGSPLHEDATKLLGRPPTYDDIDTLKTHYAEQIDARLNAPGGRDNLDAANAAFSAELKDARATDRVLVVHSAANEFSAATELGNPAWGREVTHDVDGQLTVGATTLGDPTRVGDEQIADFSSPGQVELAAPGVDAPVGVREIFGRVHGIGPDGRAAATPTNGTSFSSPYVAGTAALMAKANPALGPDQIESLLLSSSSNIAGDRDGAGVLDPVAAVQAAADARVE